MQRTLWTPLVLALAAGASWARTASADEASVPETFERYADEGLVEIISVDADGVPTRALEIYPDTGEIVFYGATGAGYAGNDGDTFTPELGAEFLDFTARATTAVQPVGGGSYAIPIGYSHTVTCKKNQFGDCFCHCDHHGTWQGLAICRDWIGIQRAGGETCWDYHYQCTAPSAVLCGP